jgi:fibronectin-binding autotransporter adhesin
LTKSGGGTWVLTNTASDYAGITTIQGGGILQIPAVANGGVASPIGAASNAAANLVFNNGTLRYTGNGSTDRLFSVAAGGGTIDASGTGPLQFTNTGDNQTTAAGARSLTLTGSNSGNNSIAGTLSNGAGTLHLVKSGAGVWSLNGSLTYTGATSVNAGTLKVGQSFRTGALLNIADGAKFAMTPRSGVPDLATSRKTLEVASLSLNATGTLDMADNDLVVNAGGFTTVQAAVLSGFGTSGPGIISSTSDGTQIHALFDNALVGATDWNGDAIASNAVVGKYTYFGDANIDGQVTGDDYGVIDANLNTTPAVGLGWLSGDMNLDGSVTGDDYGVIDANLGLGTSNPLSPSSLSAVPEPASIAAIGLSSLLIGARRRRRRS